MTSVMVVVVVVSRWWLKGNTNTTSISGNIANAS
jgi:hypothetical protein